jgi:hypothetical protein
VCCYTDDADVNLTRNSAYGLNLMRDLAQGAAPFFADLNFTMIHRGTPPRIFLTREFLADFDELWLYGFLTTGVENELSEEEVASVGAWMDEGGGVLMTGDHANPSPDGRLLGMGRALGHRMPRAGAMRRWEGPPGTAAGSRFDTQVPTSPERPSDLTLQSDECLQRLLLRRFPRDRRPAGQPATSSPHPVLIGRRGEITAFPDHQHEGALAFPACEETAHWPAGPLGVPRPYPIANGVDQRTGDVRPVLSAYDGSAAGVGRIIADTSWHHYLNINLWAIPPGEERDGLGDFFSNLAVWLAPSAARHEMARCVLWWLAHHPNVRMTLRHGVEEIGRTALGALRAECGRTDVYSVLHPSVGDVSLRDQVPHVPEELVVGSMVRELADRLASAPDDPADVITTGMLRAVTLYGDELACAAQALGEIRYELMKDVG